MHHLAWFKNFQSDVEVNNVTITIKYILAKKWLRRKDNVSYDEFDSMARNKQQYIFVQCVKLNLNTYFKFMPDHPFFDKTFFIEYRGIWICKILYVWTDLKYSYAFENGVKKNLLIFE